MSAAEDYLETISTLESEVTALTEQVEAFQSDQGGAAKRVLSLLEEKRAFEVRTQQLSDSNKDHLRKIKDLEGTILTLNEVLKGHISEKEASVAHVQDLEHRLHTEHEQIQELKKQLEVSATTCSDHEAEKKGLQFAIEGHLQKISSLEETLAADGEKDKKRQEELLLAQASVVQLGKDLVTTREQIEAQDVNTRRIEEELRHAKDELHIESSALQQTVDSLTQKLRDLEGEREKLSAHVESHEQRYQETVVELEMRATRLQDIDRKLTEALVHNKYLAESLSSTQSEHKADRETATLQIAELKNINVQLEKTLQDHQDEARKLQEASQKQLYALQARNLSLEADLGIEREVKTRLEIELKKKQEEDAELQSRILKIREEVSILRQHLEKSKEHHANQVAVLESDFEFQRQKLEGKVAEQKVEVTRQLELAQIRVFEAQDNATKKEQTLQQQLDGLGMENAELVEKYTALEKRAQEQLISLNIVNREHREVRAVAVDLQNRLQKIDMVHKQDLDKQAGYIQELQQRLANVTLSHGQIEKSYQGTLLEFKRYKTESEKVIGELRQELIGLKVKLRTKEKAYS